MALNFVLQKSLLSAQNLVLEVFIVYTLNIEQYPYKNRRNISNLTKLTESWRGPYVSDLAHCSAFVPIKINPCGPEGHMVCSYSIYSIFMVYIVIYGYKNTFVH